MNFTYRKATLNDLDMLVESRMEVLRTVYELADNVDMSELEWESREYYRTSLPNGDHIGYLIFDEDTFVGTGGVSFYKVMPTCDNPTGKKAFIMNMYTRQEYRRKGIASETLKLLLSDAKERGITCIGLEASEMGRALYIRFGFAPSDDELHLTKSAIPSPR